MAPMLRNPALRPSQAWYLQGAGSRTPRLEDRRRCCEVRQGNRQRPGGAHLVHHGNELGSSSPCGEEPADVLKPGSKQGFIYFWKELLRLLCGMWWEGASVSERDLLGGFCSGEVMAFDTGNGSGDREIKICDLIWR